MEKRISYFIISLWLVVGGCQLDSTVTERDYPLIKSLAVTEIDGTGATVEFEILKEGTATVDAYGVKYNTLNSSFIRVNSVAESSGNPNSFNRVRLSYDLVKDLEYQAVPFVRVGKKYIYGEPINFVSEGNKSPIVTSISPTKLIQWHDVIVEGDFFPSNLERISVRVEGLDDVFRFRVVSTEWKRLGIKVERRASDIPIPSEKFGTKYDLIIRINGEGFIFPETFEVDAPKITSVSKSVLQVGHEIIFETSFETDWAQNGYIRNIESEYLTSGLEKIEKIGEKTYKAIIPDVKPGKYKLGIKKEYDLMEFAEEITVLPTWELAHTIDPTGLSGFSLLRGPGDTFFSYFNTRVPVSILSVKSGKLSFCCDLPKTTAERWIFQDFVFTYSKAENALFFGLGANFQDYPNGYEFLDFHKFDLDSKKWTRLADLPNGNTSVNKSFEYDSKIYVIFWSRNSFYYFDPKTNVWVDTGIAVPDLLRKSESYYVSDDEIYIFTGPTNQGRFEVYSMEIGFQPQLILGGVAYFTTNQSSIMRHQNHLYLSFGSSNLFQVNLSDRNIVKLQSIYEFKNINGQFIELDGNLYFGLARRPSEPESYELHRLLD